MTHDFRCNRCSKILTGEHWHFTMQPRRPGWTSINIPGPRVMSANTEHSDLCNTCKAEYEIWLSVGRLQAATERLNDVERLRVAAERLKHLKT